MFIFLQFVSPVQASIFSDDKSDIEKTIDKDDGGLFEKIIAKMIGGIAETVFDLTTNESFGVGFKNYDELIFGNNQADISPFTNEQWQLIMNWYWIIAGIIGGPIFIAVVILAWKMIVAGISPDKRNDVKDSLMRLFYGAAAIVFAPLFVKFMLMLNNNLVTLLVGKSHGSLDDLLGNSLLTSINTGNAIATAIVIALFAYLFVKINIKFIIRQFTLIVFTIFTPIVAVFWIINKRTIASSIWFGQIIINAFMQFVYAFLFLIYLTFLPNNAGWAISLLWGMMILPLGDALQNTMQNLVSRIAGVNNEELANRGIGMGAAMGYTLKSIAYQFKGNGQNGESNGPSIISRVINKANGIESKPVSGVNIENHSKNIMGEQNSSSITNISNPIENKNSNTNSINQNNNGIKAVSGAKKAFNIGKEFMNLGMYMGEGRNFRTNTLHEAQNTNNRLYNRPNINNTRKEDRQDENNKIITVEVDDASD